MALRKALEPFSAPRVLFLVLGTLVLPSLGLAVMGIIVPLSADVVVGPYVALSIIAGVSIVVGTTLLARAAWREARLSRLKTDFVSHVSHELRTPLTSIRLFIETLQLGRARTTEERQECLDLLAKETARLTEMIERMLEWSRIESGKKKLSISAHPVPALVNGAVNALRAQQLDEPVPVQVIVPADLPEVWADQGAVTDVLLNLLGNAVKYGDGKEIRIVAGTAGRWVTIAVEDNGPGVPRRDRKRIFERFYRADDLLSRGTHGSGLGLSIAKRLAEGLGGRLAYQPRAGGGSRFTLSLAMALGRPEGTVAQAA